MHPELSATSLSDRASDSSHSCNRLRRPSSCLVDKASNSSNGTGNMGLRFIECDEIGDSGVKMKYPSLEEFHTGSERICGLPKTTRNSHRFPGKQSARTRLSVGLPICAARRSGEPRWRRAISRIGSARINGEHDFFMLLDEAIYSVMILSSDDGGSAAVRGRHRGSP